MFELLVVLDTWSNSKTEPICKLQATRSEQILKFNWVRLDHL